MFTKPDVFPITSDAENALTPRSPNPSITRTYPI